VLGDSCGHPELPGRDADEALEAMAELALVREAGVRGELRQGQVGSACRGCLARSTRRMMTYWCGGSPVAALNCRAKW
jgi:hypothetical protein